MLLYMFVSLYQGLRWFMVHAVDIESSKFFCETLRSGHGARNASSFPATSLHIVA